jgi:signal transduction histidine kinase/DNA-binding LacI/PurR family transcriptional regulator
MRIGLFLKNLDEEYQLSVFKGVKAEAAALDMELICVQGELLPAKRSRIEDLFPSRRFMAADGILFLSSVMIDRANFDCGEQLKTLFAGMPFVSVGDRLFDYHSIQVQVEKPMEELMEHLIVFHGYRNFLFIGGPAEHQDSVIRENIFRRFMEKYRDTYPRLRGTVVNGEFLEMSGMIIIRDYMRRHPDEPPDVIVAANDNTAIGVQNMLSRREDPRWRNCPVTGFDDISQSGLEMPTLTTIQQPLDALGKLAVRTLWDLIRGRELPRTILTGARLVIRSSCGCAAPAEPVPAEQPSYPAERYRAIANQYHLRHLSVLGRRLVVINTCAEMIRPLRFFLTSLDVPLFFLILYERPRPDMGSAGRLIYERTRDRDLSHVDNPLTVDIARFMRELGQYSGISRTWCLTHLRSGSEFLGLVIYGVPDDIQPQLCNGLILLANTVKRLFIYGDEMERASQLEREVREEVRRRMEVEAEVLRISEMERLRFSSDLHDDICQRLAGISMFSKSLAARKQDGRGAGDLRELSQLIDETLLRTRQYAHDSFPRELDTLGLKDSLEALCSAVNKQTHCECLYSWSAGDRSPLNSSQDINVYRIMQEALQNAVKHARANRITVEISVKDGWFTASVQDNGTGSPELNEAKSVSHNKGRREGLGLRSMRYRAHQAGAEYCFDSREIGGTLVKIRIPVL